MTSSELCSLFKAQFCHSPSLKGVVIAVIFDNMCKELSSVRGTQQTSAQVQPKAAGGVNTGHSVRRT